LIAADTIKGKSANEMLEGFLAGRISAEFG
jgi:hypothetical protein